MKRRLAFCAFLAMFLVIPALAQRVPPPPAREKDNKESKVLPALVAKAQFVMVMSQREADFGQRPDVFDLKAVNDVENAVHKWGRYKLVYRKEDADLIFSVRRAGASLGPAGAPRPSPGGGLGMDYASEGDYLAVYNAHTGTSGAKLWSKAQKDGLATPKMPLLQAFQDDVEKSATKTP